MSELKQRRERLVQEIVYAAQSLRSPYAQPHVFRENLNHLFQAYEAALMRAVGAPPPETSKEQT